MLNSSIISFLLFSGSVVLAQSSVSGLLTHGGEGIPFANISVLHTNIRTVTSHEGQFELDIQSISQSDTISFSCVGYKSRKMLVKDFLTRLRENGSIELEEEIVELPEYVFDGREMKEKVLGNPKAGSFLQIGFSQVGPGDQVGTIIKIKESPTFVESFTAHITYLDNDSMKLRLNFFSLKKGLPDKKIPVPNIIIDTKNLSAGLHTIDLREYNIVVEDDFYISLECIENADSVKRLVFAGSLLNGPIIGEKKEESEWMKYGAFGIGFSVRVQY